MGNGQSGQSGLSERELQTAKKIESNRKRIDNNSKQMFEALVNLEENMEKITVAERDAFDQLLNKLIKKEIFTENEAMELEIL